MRFACESQDTETIVATLKAAGIKLINKTLQMCYDEHSYRYDVPVFMINDPSAFEEKKAEEIVESKELHVSSQSSSSSSVPLRTTR